ncbi:hypothetical protein Tco_0191089 [Tanacetum coccineum]
MIIKKDSEIVKAKVCKKNLLCILKAKKESSNEDVFVSQVVMPNEYVMAVRRSSRNSLREKRNVLDAVTRIILLENVQNHQKTRTKELSSEVLGAIAAIEDDEKVKDETCLVAQASSEEESHYSENFKKRCSRVRELHNLLDKVVSVGTAPGPNSSDHNVNTITNGDGICTQVCFSTTVRGCKDLQLQK